VTGACQDRVDGRGGVRADLTVDLETVTLLEMCDGRIGRTTERAGAFEIVPELGECELKRADEISFIPHLQGAISKQRGERRPCRGDIRGR
jgi:hypothetical protein